MKKTTDLKKNKSKVFVFDRVKNVQQISLCEQREKRKRFALAIKRRNQIKIKKTDFYKRGGSLHVLHRGRLLSCFLQGENTTREVAPDSVFSKEKTLQEESSLNSTVNLFSLPPKSDKPKNLSSFNIDGPLSEKSTVVASQLLQFLKSSSHFGRKSRQLDFAFPWHPSMCSKFSGIRNKVAQISVEETLQSLVEAFYCIALILRKGGKVLVVNKNSEFFPLFDTQSFDTRNPPHANHGNSMETTSFMKHKNSPLILFSPKRKQDKRPPLDWKTQSRPAIAPLSWVGGCLTNWKEISKSVATLLYFSKRFGQFIKQNNIHFPRFKKMEKSFQGFIDRKKGGVLLKEKPGVVFLFNAYESQQILQEAIALQIPVVALTDSSTDLSQITYPIPINSDSVELVHKCLSQLMQITNRQGMFSLKEKRAGF